MKQIMNWTEKKYFKLQVFWSIEERDGCVGIGELADTIGETRTALYNWANYCLENGIIKEGVDSRYEILPFGKELLGAE